MPIPGVPAVAETSASELDARCRDAELAFGELGEAGRGGRAAMLRAMADALEARRDEIVRVADEESSLGAARLGGELTRTCFQLGFFAEVLEDGAYLEATIDHAGETAMGPRPDLRRMLVPLGPVAVFGASNFPLAFSVPGGDTASALAAGCPVLAKIHPSQPLTGALCAEALEAGARQVGFSSQVLALVSGEAAGVALVAHRSVNAVGFTGSVRGGQYLSKVAASRPDPIPFYGELGALNTVVVAPGAAAARGAEIAAGLAASFSLGVGQFCTKPGLVLVPSGEAGDALRAALVGAVAELPGGTMLSPAIAEGFASSSAALRAAEGATVLAEGMHPRAASRVGVPLLLEADAGSLDGVLLEECFGPALVLVSYRDAKELAALLGRVPPALTATLHGEDEDGELSAAVLGQLSGQVGRLVWNGYPTGVAVAWAMHHGGPFPATTDPLHTSVGASAIRRWLRPVCYQGLPERFLPEELRDEPDGDHRVARRVDGRLILENAT